MKTNAATRKQQAENIITLAMEAPRLGRIPKDENHDTNGARRQRFRILPFVNESGTKSWRVQGMDRQGRYIRQNFADMKAAQCRQLELEAEWLGRQPQESNVRATKMSETQLRIAEACFLKLDADEEMMLAINHWLQHGRNQAVKVEAPRLDDAAQQFIAWLDTAKFRPETKTGLRIRVNRFANSVHNHRLSDITIEMIEDFLDKRKVAALTKDNDKRALSRFFRWCIERPRRWITTNPCREIHLEKDEKQPPVILDVATCEKLLRAAETFKAGRLAPYIAIALFAGLRPFELRRLSWQKINLPDAEIRLEASETKTKKPRVVTICKTLLAWLQAYKGEPIYPPNWLRDFREVCSLAGVAKWHPDVARHTAVSHYFRATGSYGRTAEQFGNSESVIKAHYQSRVSSDDTKKFYGILPSKKGGAK